MCRQVHSHTFNVTQLGIAFFFVFFAFNSQGFIEQTVIDSKNAEGVVSKHAGYISLAIIYFVFTFANFFAAPIVEALKAKWSMVAGALTYAVFQAGFLFLNEPFLYISSGLMGVGAAVIWTAQGKYLSLNSTEETAGKHSGIFWAISQACLAFGGIFLFIVFHFSGGKDLHIPDATVRILYGVFAAVTLLGVLIFAFLRMPGTHSELDAAETFSDTSPVLSNWEVMVSTYELSKTKTMLVMVIVFAYTGIELSFWSGIYPTCISHTLKLGSNTKSLVAINAITQGAGQAVSGFLFGILSSKTRLLGRHTVVLLGTIVHLLVFVAVFLNFPNEAPLDNTHNAGIIQPSVAIALICGFFLGFGDACWNTQVFAFLIAKYPRKSAQAFSLFKFFQSLLTCATFFYGTSLQLQWHLLILAIGAVLGCIAFFAAERIPVAEEDTASSTSSHHD